MDEMGLASPKPFAVRCEAGTPIEMSCCITGSALLRKCEIVSGVSKSQSFAISEAIEASRFVTPPASCDTSTTRTRLYRISMSG